MAQRRLRARLVVGVVAAIALGAFSVGTALAADHAVAISGSSFSPGDVTVTVGDTVTWTNSDQISHTATADGGSFDTGVLGNNESGTITFSTAGSFPYHCTIHTNMTGTITVEAPASGGGGGGGSATQPPTDTELLPVPSGSDEHGAAIVLAGAALLGFLIARRRLNRAS
ncbi:MAG TPA: plastocyanin/azurin family copper-binding protein [Candidatus Limnocylindrales bacterium]|nr:plastocyanin/azurin family copper-binding protein [Candidatus Limnocylindrales bacterium]